jgi:hypothetical protein
MWNELLGALFVPFAACWMFAASCVQQSEGQIMVTRTQAVQIAKAEFTRAGYAVSDYEVTIDSDVPREKCWMIWFDKKGPFPIPGGRHAVSVDKFTGQSVFMPGE